MKLSPSLPPASGASGGRPFLLVENPGTGNVSVAQALGLRPVQGVPPHSRPADKRLSFDDAPQGWGWSDMFKVVLVRDPAARFATLATALYAASPEERLGLSGEVRELLEENADASKMQKGKALLRFLLDGGCVTDAFLSQRSWLTFKPDAIIATPDIAEWFNKVGGTTCHRLNTFRSNPTMRLFHVDADEAMVRELYKEDYELFTKLRVWHPDPQVVRLVSGPCRKCSSHLAALGAAKAEDAADSTPPVPPAMDLHERAKGGEAEEEEAPRRPLRKRRR